VDLFIQGFTHPIQFGIAIVVAGAMVVIFLRSAMVAERAGGGLGRVMGRPSAKYLMGLLFVLWAVVFGIGLQLVPHTGADSPYGGLAFIGLILGFFIMMGFLWAVIGE
jgi:hypothetical protein